MFLCGYYSVPPVISVITAKKEEGEGEAAHSPTVATKARMIWQLLSVQFHPLQPLLADSTPSPLVSSISLEHPYLKDFVPSIFLTWNILHQ